MAAGETKTVAEALGDVTPVAGDWIKKTGAGTLMAVANYKSIQLNWSIREGVYYVPNSVGTGAHKGNSTLIVADGATMNLQGGVSKAFDGRWQVQFAGAGTGKDDNLGALAIGGGLINPLFGEDSRFVLTGDATLYGYGTMNAVFSGSGAHAGPVFDMGGHTLTVRGKTANAVFRPRWKWVIENPGPFVIRNGVFARHKTTNDFEEGIPRITFTEGARMATYSSPSLWDLVDEFVFDRGTSLANVNGEANAVMTLKRVEGAPAVGTDVASLTISERLVARGADLAAGACLTATNALVFADGCELDVTGWETLSYAAGTTYVAARSHKAITGTPTLSAQVAHFFTVSNTGTALVLTVKDNVIDVAARAPLAEGAEAAEANAAAWAALCAAEGAKDDRVYVFKAGDWSFGATLDATACTGARPLFVGTGAGSILHSSLAVGAASDATVRNLTFAGVEGPAVVATQTAGLTISDCALDGVAGMWTNGTNYPFAATAVTDLEVTGNTFTNATYAAPAWLEGGSQTAQSEVQAGTFVANVPSGQWWDWATVLRQACLTTDVTALTGRKLLKVGAGTLDPSADLATRGLTDVEVREGQYVSRLDMHLGVAKSPVRVQAGANLTLAGKDNTPSAQARTITIAGTGLNAKNPAVRFTSAACWNQAHSITWILAGDATMYDAVEGEMGAFLWSTVKANGHTLTLTGVSDKANFRFGRACRWSGGGTVVVNGVSLSASTPDNGGFAVADGEPAPQFTFTNGARLIPDSHGIFNLIRQADFAAGTQILTKNGNKAAAPFQRLEGAPTATADITNLIVRGVYRARAADVFASTPAVLTSAGAITFAAGATFELDDPLAKPVTAQYMLCEAAGGVTGKPQPAGATAAAGWQVSKQGATRLLIGPPVGTVILLR